MTTFLAWSVVITIGIAWLVHLVVPERGAVIWVRFGAISALLVFVLGFWGLIRYGAALVRWVWHLL